LFDGCRDINNASPLLKQVIFCYHRMKKKLDKVFFNGFNIKLIIGVVMRFYVDCPDSGDVDDFGQVCIKLKQYVNTFKNTFLADLNAIESFSLNSDLWGVFDDRCTNTLRVINELEEQYNALLNHLDDDRLGVFREKITGLSNSLSLVVRPLFASTGVLLPQASMPLSAFFGEWERRVFGCAGAGFVVHDDRARFQCLLHWSSQLDGVILFWESAIGMTVQHAIKLWGETQYARLVSQSVIHVSVSDFINSALSAASRYRNQADSSSKNLFSAVSSWNCERKACRIESACDTLKWVIVCRVDSSLAVEGITLSEFLAYADDRDVGSSLRAVVEALNSARIWRKSDAGHRTLQACDSVSPAVSMRL